MTTAGVSDVYMILLVFQQDTSRAAQPHGTAWRFRLHDNPFQPQAGIEVRWTPIFGRPDKVKLPGWEAPYQEQDDGREAASVWRGLQGEGGVGGRLKMEVEWLKKATEVG